MTLLKMAVRNLFRYRRRTLITASALAYGIIMFIFVDSFMSGANEETYRNLREHDTGDAQILASGWWEKKEELSLDYVIEDPAFIEDLLQDDITWSPHIDFPADMLFYRSDGYVEDGNLPVRVRAVDPLRVREIYTQFDDMEEGNMFGPDDSGVLLGSWFAEKLGARVDSFLLLQVKTRYGAHDVIELTVGGIIHTSDMTLNRTAVYIPLNVADEYLEMDGAVTGYTLKADDDEVSSLRDAVGGRARVLGFYELTEDFKAMADISDSIMFVILLFLFIIAAVGVSNTMMMGVFERKYEVGMMRSMGMKDSAILKTFIFEAMGIGFLGVLIGLALSIPLNVFLVNHGLDYTFMFEEFDAGYRTTGVLRGVWKTGSFLACIILGLILSGIMAVFPTRRILKKSISDNLRF